MQRDAHPLMDGERNVMVDGQRSTCRACGSSDLSTFLQLGALPLSDGFRWEADLASPERRYPLDVALCQACALVQILYTVPPEALFCVDYPYFSSFTESLLVHSQKNVASVVAQRSLNQESLVVELASNDGYLLQYYVQRGIPVLGIDPADGPVEAARKRGIPTRHAFFSQELAQNLRQEDIRADVIHANNVLAHVADINGFVAGIRLLLKEHGVAVLEVPYVRDLIDGCEFDTIYHEHLCYFSVTALRALFRRHHLFLNHVQSLAIHGGSLRLFVEPVDNPSPEVISRLEDEEAHGLTGIDYYKDFSARVTAVKAQLQALLARLAREGKSVAAYGAAAKGTILLNHVGIGRKTLAWVADRNVHKQGRYMPGVAVPVVDPARILQDMPDYLLLLPWNFKDEILAQQAEYRRRGGKFIIPIPTPEIV